MRWWIVGLMSVLGGIAAAEEAPWIGLELAPGAHGGVAVRSVVETSPGAKAHIRAGEEVLEAGGAKVTTADELIRSVQTRGAGVHLMLKVVGASGERTVDVLLEARPEPGALQRQLLVGQPAPDFTPRVVAGGKIGKLSSLKGRVVLIDFFATWCGPCREAMPTIERLHERLGKKGLQVVGISTEEPKIVAGAARLFHLRYPLVGDVDRTISTHYHVFALPTVVLVDRRGVVHEITIADADALEQSVTRLLGEP